MELNIEELDYDYEYNYEQEQEEIPENRAPVKVIKKNTRFDEFITTMNQYILKENERILGAKNIIINDPIIKNPIIKNPIIKDPIIKDPIIKDLIIKPQISYEDILSKMGMFVSNGKLYLSDNNNHQSTQPLQSVKPQQQHQQQQYQQNIPPNSYIYNKYFKEDMQPQDTIRRPMTRDEYKRMLLEDILQRQRIKEIKSTKLIMPTSNINIASRNSSNLNKLFNLTKR